MSEYTIDQLHKRFIRGDYDPTKPSYNDTIIYPNGTILDENLTVAQNRELVDKLNTTHRDNAKKYHEKVNNVNSIIKEDVIVALMYEYSISREIATIIEEYTWQNHHYSMDAYFGSLRQTADFALLIIGAYKETSQM